MRPFPLIVCALAFALPAKADRFWLADPAAEQNVPEGSSPPVIDGVLLEETEQTYRIRVVGGEIVLQKSAVHRVDKNGLTLESIAQSEQDAAERNALANRERELAQEVARRERQVRIAEASARRAEAQAMTPAPVAVATPVPSLVFDPVIGVVRSENVSPAELLRDVQLGYNLTQDRRLLRLLRQLRRLR